MSGREKDPLKLTPIYAIRVEGEPAPGELVESLVSVSARLDLELSDTIELRLSNQDLEWTESKFLEEGKTIALELGYADTGTQLLATGKIVRRECDFPERGPSTVTVVLANRCGTSVMLAMP